MGDPGAGSDRYKHLPEPVRVEDTVTTSDVDPHTPMQEESAEAAWVVRYAAT